MTMVLHKFVFKHLVQSFKLPEHRNIDLEDSEWNIPIRVYIVAILYNSNKKLPGRNIMTTLFRAIEILNAQRFQECPSEITIQLAILVFISLRVI